MLNVKLMIDLKNNIHATKRKQDNIIILKTFKFSLKIIKLYQNLKAVNEFELSKRLLRSGTSIGANVEESTAAQTKKDFIAKMSIASKEARETKYWIRLIAESSINKYDFNEYLNDVNEIISILTAIVKTSQANINN